MTTIDEDTVDDNSSTTQTTGEYGYNPGYDDILAEAFERALMNPAHQGIDRIMGALRSANYVLQDFSNKGQKAYELALYEFPTVVGQPSYVMPEQFLRPVVMTRRRFGVDIPVLSISREDYEWIPNKQATGAITEIFWDASGAFAGEPRSMYVWPVNDLDTDTMRFWFIQAPQIVNAQQLNATAPISTEWLDAFTDALAVRLAMKYNPSAMAPPPAGNNILAAAAASFAVARQADRQVAPIRIRMSTRGRWGWR
jgi:hypothetical protein